MVFGSKFLSVESALHLAGKLAIFLAMSKTVNIAEFKDRFSELLALVEQGGEVIVCRRNVPLARVEPIRKPASRKASHSVVGCMKGTVRIHGDLTEPCISEADWEMLK
jgi:prevent-host-death family protein